MRTIFLSLVFFSSSAFATSLHEAVFRLLDESGSNLSRAQQEQFEELLESKRLLAHEHVDAQTINAIGELLLRSNEDDAFQQRQLDDLSDLWSRTGIDVDPEGFAYLADSVEKAHGRPPIFGAVPTIRDGIIIPPKEYVETARDRIGLRPSTAFYAGVNMQLAAGTKPDVALKRSLASRYPKYPSDWPLHTQLVQLARKDQSVREGKIDKQRMREADNQDHAELIRIIDRHGFPDSLTVGRFGIFAIWLVVQHQIDDPDLMKRYREYAKGAMDRGELPRVSYALLDDRIRCYIDGQLEIYGTQPGGVDEKGPYIPVADPAHVNAIRASMLMAPLDVSKARGDCKAMAAVFKATPATHPSQ